MLKHELRKKYRNLRTDLTSSKISDYSITLANHVLRIPIWDFFYFHTFLSIQENKEVDTLPLITMLQGKDKHVVVPKVSGVNTMDNYLLTDSTVLRKNKWNIPEPEDGIPIPEEKIDVVFIPLMAFDMEGNRVGYGKGFYDTFLSKCREDVIKIGLSFFEPEKNPITDVSQSDVKLNYCVTPNKVYEF
ncbi:5-formyltetrahydrofolate cyclo-ligase [Flagellimonas nanhaiensis]|uniref:5-formyltetrahydrofolate cyclo-ligase n=1 Tax=Flagellimonas nanhaiensis TaxID=2292706 RepID=A0A371JQ26_9FLAO|nr:5-formyltetrahydrofolate cyclo-ligase [Allomuricauda nanhaiensis]RDY59624.1 5-formyltetrahydrofolate cyclo-ligase [Allomuricauda nanhaiensis]